MATPTTPPLYAVERVLPAAVERVWAAWTDADKLAAWYGPVGFETPRDTVTVNAIVGGTWGATVVVPADGSRHRFFGEYREVEPLSKLVFTMHFASGDATSQAAQCDPARTPELIVLAFAAVDGGTRLTFSQYGSLPAEHVPMAKAGMESYFDSLSKYLEAKESQEKQHAANDTN